MKLLLMSFAGAVMILAVIVIRALCIHKIPKISFLILWGIVLLRLLIPVTIPSAFSIYSIIQKPFWEKPENTAAFGEQTELFETAETSKAAGMGAESSVIWEMPDLSVPDDMVVAVLPVWKILWLAGLIMCTGYFAAAYFKCRREFQMSLPVDNDMIKQWMEDHVPASFGIRAVQKPVEIRRLDRISTPVSYGVTRPVILLPREDMPDDAETMRYVLEHEYVHIQRFDTVTKLLMTAAACIHWFNPLVWIMYFLLNRDIELSCDETVLWRMGGNGKAFYARMLINMEETKIRLTPFYNGFSKNALEERIVAIMKMRKTSKTVWMLVTVLIVGVAVVFGTMPEAGTVSAHKYESDMQEDASEAAALNAEADELTETSGPTALAEEEYDYRKALKKYEEFGVSDQNGLMYYKGERIRFFLDGYEMDNCIIARYQYYDGKGTVDVHTLRNDIQNADGSTELFGEIVDIVAYPQEEFDKRNYAAVWWNNNSVEATSMTESTVEEVEESEAASVEKTYGFVAGQIEEDEIRLTEEATATGNTVTMTEVKGMTLKEKIDGYGEYGITYQKTADGKEILYLDGLKIRTFVEKKPDGSIFSYSIEEGDVDVRVLYNDNGVVTGIEKEYIKSISE